jgi:microsomal dipeptidase-like Zn-dependent dipeptidase
MRLSATFLLTATLAVTATAQVGDHAMQVYRAAYVIDTHNDLPSKMADDSVNPDVRHPADMKVQSDLPRFMESGITAVFLSDFVNATYALQKPDASYARAVQLADSIHSFANRNPKQLIFATTAADVERAKKEGKVAILIGVEGGHAIEGSLDKLRDLYKRGMRYMTLTWNNGNSWAGSNAGLNGTSKGGLTPFGIQVIHEMNRLGIFVDISHVSDSTFWDAVKASSKPVIASHSSARALSPHRRNMTDDMLRAVAKNGALARLDAEGDARRRQREAHRRGERQGAGGARRRPASRALRAPRPLRSHREGGRRRSRRDRERLRRHRGHAAADGGRHDAPAHRAGTPRSRLQRRGREEDPRRQHAPRHEDRAQAGEVAGARVQMHEAAARPVRAAASLRGSPRAWLSVRPGSRPTGRG